MPITLRHALRALRKSPLFACVAIVSLGVALALNTTMFALVDSVLHPAVPYREPARLFTVWLGGGDRRRAPLPWPERLQAVREGTRSFEGVASYGWWVGLVEAGTKIERRTYTAVSPNFFDVLGVRPAMGRALGAADAGAGAPPAAAISYRMWKGAFAGRPLDGLWLGIEGRRYAVAGVMPRGMHTTGTDVWIPLGAADASRPVLPLVRLRPGVTQEAAQAELAIVAARLTAAFGVPDRPYVARLSSMAPTPRRVDTFYQFMLGAVSAVLLIACANLGTMMLARGLARRRDTAVRVALGASRGAIIREVLTECGLLAGAGGALGVLLTVWSIYILTNRGARYVADLGDLAPVPSWRVFAFAFGASLLTMLLAGVLPALRAAGTDPAEPMKEGSGNTTGKTRDRYSPLVMIEVALSTAVLMMAAMFIAGVFKLANTRFPFDARKLVTTRIIVPPGVAQRFFDDLVERAAHVPGARLAATSHDQGPDGLMVTSEVGRSGERWMNLRGYTEVSPEYLRTMGIPVVQGRDFTAGDREAAATDGGAFVIVDEAAAHRLWLDLPSPVGRRIKLGHADSKRPWLRVIGVARSTASGPRDDPYRVPDPDIYVLAARDTAGMRTLVVRGIEDQTAQSPMALALHRELQRVAPQSAIDPVTAMTAGYDESLATQRFLAALFSAFGAFAVALCAIGLYGTLAYSVSRRMREFAVRIALGARRPDILRIVLHDVAVMALAGIGVGAFVAIAVASRFDVAAGRWVGVLSLVAAESVLLLAAVVASLEPVRRAAGADPVEALRAT